MTDEEDRSRPPNTDFGSKERSLATDEQSHKSADEILVSSLFKDDTKLSVDEKVIKFGAGSRLRNEPDKNRDAKDAASGKEHGGGDGDGGDGGGGGSQAAPGQPNPPEGWRFVDADCLKKLGDADTFDLRSYFRRGAVNLKIAGHPAIKPLNAEGSPIGPERIHEELGRRAAEDVKPVVIWLGGVCGSGKSTAFYVVLRRFVECGEQNHCVLIRNNNEAFQNNSTDFPAEVLSACTQTGNKRYVVAFDNAGPDLETIFELLKLLRDRRRHDIDVVFVCDESDWRRYQTKGQDAKARLKRWEEVAALEHLQFRYVNRNDIAQITEALYAAELCSLNERNQRMRDIQRAVLNGNDRSSVTGSGYSGFPRRLPDRMSDANKRETVFDGPLLGASLEDSGTRECARKCVERFMEHLKTQDERENTGYTTAVRLVAVAEAVGIDFLSEAVLLQAIVDKGHRNAIEIIENLKHEITYVNGSNTSIKTRHFNISERIVENEYDLLYNLLVASARLFRQKIIQPECWRRWCDRGIAELVKNVQNTLAISTLEELAKELPACWRAWCVWAELRLRQDPRPGLSILPKTIFNPSAGFEAVILLAELCQKLSVQGYPYEGLELYFSMRALADQNSVSGVQNGGSLILNSEQAMQLISRIKYIYPSFIQKTRNIDGAIDQYMYLFSGAQSSILGDSNCESALRDLALKLSQCVSPEIFKLISSVCLPPSNWTYYGLRSLGTKNPTGRRSR